jgi:hypothetical protein
MDIVHEIIRLGVTDERGNFDRVMSGAARGGH